VKKEVWLSKFLDFKDDIKELTSELKIKIFEEIKKDKLTPLEFTILESIFNKKAISGYDLIQTLNQHFAGTWEARSGTIYPILSKLKRNGFLNIKTVKSPIGPLRKLYSLTKAGEQLLKRKVNKNFYDQVKFIENFLIELSRIYLESLPEIDKDNVVKEIDDLIRNMFENIRIKLHLFPGKKFKCTNCGAINENINASYCSFCGKYLISKKDNNNNKFNSVERLKEKSEDHI